MKLQDLKADRPFKAYLYIREASVRDSKNGSRFIRLQLSDPEYREVTGYVWNANDADVEDYVTGRIVGIAGKGKEFQATFSWIFRRSGWQTTVTAFRLETSSRRLRTARRRCLKK